ncbi:MAG: hypothetical protein ABII18_11550 [bacterium]|nr:hypothetical protein [bacterium]MBU1918745.1 hypothetical protein [bacterium]
MAKTTNMQEHELKKHQKRSRKKQPPVSLDEIHKKNGYYDGNIFFAQDKATYTFLHENNVTVIHLDALRLSFYLNGHKINSIEDHPDLPDFLAQFKRCLCQNPQTEHLIKPFQTIVAHISETS